MVHLLRCSASLDSINQCKASRSLANGNKPLHQLQREPLPAFVSASLLNFAEICIFLPLKHKRSLTKRRLNITGGLNPDCTNRKLSRCALLFGQALLAADSTCERVLMATPGNGQQVHTNTQLRAKTSVKWAKSDREWPI